MIHNALNQLTVSTGEYTIQGFAISGLASYIQVPELDLCFDMGECPVSAISLNNIFLTHSHGDHSRCLLRHFTLRKMLNIPATPHYYIPDHLHETAIDWVIAESVFEGVNRDYVQIPHFVPVNPEMGYIKFENRKDLFFKCFVVDHTQPALAYTIYRHKKKLKKEYIGLPAQELIDLRNNGNRLENDVYTPEVTYIADCRESSMNTPEIWKSKVLLLEATFLLPGEESLAGARGHSHINDIVKYLIKYEDSIECTHIIIKHFSMKYSRRQIIDTIKKAVPERFMDRVHIFV
ncbi:MAG: hypothetical protein OCC49_03995 [Fibrobacterales bacterium]